MFFSACFGWSAVGQRCTVFDAITQVELMEIERILAVALVQYEGGIMGYERAKRRCRVVCQRDFFGQLSELDIAAIGVRAV